eukprot:260941-Chlamydomonas_euryale.AAC.7
MQAKRQRGPAPANRAGPLSHTSVSHKRPRRATPAARAAGASLLRQHERGASQALTVRLHLLPRPKKNPARERTRVLRAARRHA